MEFFRFFWQIIAQNRLLKTKPTSIAWITVQMALKISRIYPQKIRRGPKLEGCAFANFGNLSGTEGEPSQKREKKGKRKNNQCCLDIEPGTC